MLLRLRIVVIVESIPIGMLKLSISIERSEKGKSITIIVNDYVSCHSSVTPTISHWELRGGGSMIREVPEI